MNSHPEKLTGAKMFDQASELRKLVLRSVRRQVSAAGPAPRLIVVAAGKGGVGATTTAVNLSVALAEHGSRVVIVDADLSSAGVATLCGLSGEQSAGDILFARRDIHEVLQRGPAGIQVVPGLFAHGVQAEWSEVAQQRLLRQLHTLGKHADIVVLDTGSGSHGFLRRCSEVADHLLFVTTAESPAVMDTYACVKSSLADLDPQHLGLVVNLCTDEEIGSHVHERIDQSCRRFLGHEVELVATLPDDPQVRFAETRAVPFVLTASRSPAAEAVTQLAALILKKPCGREEIARDAA